MKIHNDEINKQLNHAETPTALFNPNAASCFALLFTVPYSCILHAMNWKSLGDEKMARLNYICSVLILIIFILSYIISTYIILSENSILSPGYLAIFPPTEYKRNIYDNCVSIMFFLNLYLLLPWYLILGKKQKNHSKKIYGKNYPRRNLKMPVLLGAIYSIVFAILTLLITAISSKFFI